MKGERDHYQIKERAIEIGESRGSHVLHLLEGKMGASITFFTFIYIYMIDFDWLHITYLDGGDW